MALQLITGPSGSGKTYCANRMIVEEATKNPDVNYFVVVPEQLNLHSQQDFLSISPTHTLFNIDVISFERLVERLISHCGMVTPTLVDDTGKCLVLRKVAGDVKEDLTVFKRAVAKPGFIQLMKSMLSELLQYDITDEKLEELSKTEHMPAGLSGKLHDMFLIYRAFNNAMDDGIPKESLLSYVNEMLPKANGIVENSVFLFDGFTGFTPLQERLVQSLLSMSRNVYVTVTIDANSLSDKQSDDFDLFYMSHIAINNVYRCAEKAKVKVLSPIVLTENKRTKKDDLRHLEQNLFRKKKTPYDEAPKSIHVAETESPLTEVQSVAEEIYTLVSQKGYHYKDIAVITGNMEAYIPHISRVFTQANFAYYMDTKKNIHDMPVISYLLYALKSIQWNADYENMFSFLKSGMVLTVKECSILENYVLAKGIRGFSSWTREWKKEMYHMDGYSLAQINELRKRAICNLLPLKEVLDNEESTSIDVLTALVTMMQADNVFERIEEKRVWYAEHGDAVKEKLYEQLYEKIMEVFDQFAQTLSNKKLATSEYFDILLAGFSEIKAGTIPATSDCIIVGDMERTRVEDIKVLFFIGLNEGNVPVLDTKVDLLNKQDRDVLSSDFGMELTPSLETKQAFQKFYFYLLLTKPSEHLYLYYPEMNNQGTSANQSSYLKELRQIFPECTDSYEMPGKYYINNATMLDMYAEELRVIPEKGISSRFIEIAGDLWSREENRENMLSMLDRAFFAYQPQSIGMDRACSLYGNIIHSSATRLETAAACPFSHFLKYGIGVVERDTYEVSQKDMGSIYHMALEEFFRITKASAVDWMELPVEQRMDYVATCMENITENYRDKLFKSTAKNRYFTQRICTVISNTVGILSKQIKSAGYTVKDVEINFSGKESADLNIPLENGNQMVISGRVDRLDIKESENNVMYAKVVDYKTGSTSFDATLAYNGLQLQLMYMDAATGMVQKEYPEKDVHSGGFAYYHIEDKYVETDGMESTEQLDSKILKAMEMSGIINLAAEPEAKKNGIEETTLQSIQNHVKSEAGRIGNEIAQGKVDVSPYRRKDKSGREQSACVFCAYKAVCGFETGLPGYGYRVLRERSTGDFEA